MVERWPLGQHVEEAVKPNPALPKRLHVRVPRRPPVVPRRGRRRVVVVGLQQEKVAAWRDSPNVNCIPPFPGDDGGFGRLYPANNVVRSVDDRG